MPRRSKTESVNMVDWIKNSGVDWLKIVAIVFFGGVFWSQFNTSQQDTEKRFSEFKVTAEKRDDRMEELQKAQNTLVNQLTEIKGDMKSQLTEIKGDMKGLSTGMSDIKNSLAQQQKR